MRVQSRNRPGRSLGQSDLVITPSGSTMWRCSLGRWSDGLPEVLTGISPPLEATKNQLGWSGRDLVGVYPHGRRPSEGVGRNLSQGYVPHSEPLTAQVIEPLDFMTTG